MTVLLPSSIASANLPLVLAVVPAAAAYALAHPKWRHLPCMELLARHQSRRTHLIWALLFITSLLAMLGASLEIYHSHGCPNSSLFQFEIESLARWLYEFCARHEMPYWVVFGNLLFVLRGDVQIPVGDTDSDIAMEKSAFLLRFQSIDNFTRLATLDAAMELHTKVHLIYRQDRELLQIYLNKELTGSHADIWFYTPEGGVDPPQYLVNNDRTIRAKKLQYDQIMPLQEASAHHFLNTPVQMPRNPAYSAQAEYGKSFMTPLVTKLECMENLWNGYTFYKRPIQRQQFIGRVLFLSAAMTLLLAFAIPPLRRQLLQSANKKRRASSSIGSDAHSTNNGNSESQPFMLDKDIV